MAMTYTSNARLQKPGTADRGWDVPLRANLDALDALSPVGGLCVTPHEQPSASLRVDVAAGSYRTAWGQTASYAGGSATLAASATNHVYLDSAGTLQHDATGFPAAAHLPLATVVTGSAAVASIADARPAFAMVVPVTQPTLGAATAGASYTSTEQGMLQTLWDAFRTLGLGT